MSPTPAHLDPWIAELAPRLGLAGEEVPTQIVLDIARDVAHRVVRPGAPVSTFMIGLALGRGDLESPEQGMQAVTDALAAWAQRGDNADPEGAEATDPVTMAEADSAGVAGEVDGGAA